MFLDATYEGDLLAAAGVAFHVGREANSKYNETLNGIQKQKNNHNHRFTAKVDPYVIPGDPKVVCFLELKLAHIQKMVLKIIDFRLTASVCV